MYPAIPGTLWWSGALWLTVSTNPQWRRDPRYRRRSQRAAGACRSPLVRSTQRLKPEAGRKGTERPWRDGNVRITPPQGVWFANCCLRMRGGRACLSCRLLSQRRPVLLGPPERLALCPASLFIFSSSKGSDELGWLSRTLVRAIFPRLHGPARLRAQWTSSVPGHCLW
jgi:hypothetical protein